ncbi:polysaccharide deacetylase family protein [Allosalinactinospora lopnorensis]|uniref:polysaccharide deacetylase family protein n=1 Tax=Allosalinactinospora lopnorensis TaxID=1352348 RepID=UPI000623B9E3|nr:polysaccharide deacetylase family protein [Allosalinactinospora lopnorensis]
MVRTGTEPVWPGGRRAALSLTFDDARASQVDTGLPVLDRWRVKGTFYVLPQPVRSRLPDWQEAVSAGHEIGNHSLSHPCSGNFTFSRQNPLESYTLERMEEDILSANRAIERLLRVSPTTFAYPCGQHTVGRGEDARSYVPLAARHFLVGRGWLGEVANDPLRCDLAQITALKIDGASPGALRGMVDDAIEAGTWLVLGAHDVGSPGAQSVDAGSLDALCSYARDRSEVLWVETVRGVGTRLASLRAGR